MVGESVAAFRVHTRTLAGSAQADKSWAGEVFGEVVLAIFSPVFLGLSAATPTFLA